MGAAPSAPVTLGEPIIVTDTREQQRYSFPRSVVRGLPLGDYSVDGLEGRVALERKSKPDAYRSLGHARERFRREIEGLARLDYAAIIIESSLTQFLIAPPFSDLHPNAAIGTLLSWSVRYRLPVFFTCDREHGQKTTHELLRRFAWYAERGGLAYDR